MTGPDETIEDERRRARRVRLIVDSTCAMIAQGRFRRREAEHLVEGARAQILALFPGREITYDIVCAPRFRRCIEEFTRQDADRRAGVVLAFSAKTSPH
jgi:hypothetical protein